MLLSSFKIHYKICILLCLTQPFFIIIHNFVNDWPFRKVTLYCTLIIAPMSCVLLTHSFISLSSMCGENVRQNFPFQVKVFSNGFRMRATKNDVDAFIQTTCLSNTQRTQSRFNSKWRCLFINLTLKHKVLLALSFFYELRMVGNIFYSNIFVRWQWERTIFITFIILDIWPWRLF